MHYQNTLFCLGPSQDEHRVRWHRPHPCPGNRPRPWARTEGKLDARNACGQGPTQRVCRLSKIKLFELPLRICIYSLVLTTSSCNHAFSVAGKHPPPQGLGPTQGIAHDPRRESKGGRGAWNTCGKHPRQRVCLFFLWSNYWNTRWECRSYS